MKHFILLLALFSFSFVFPQEPEGSIDKEKLQSEMESVYIAAVRNDITKYRTQYAPLLQRHRDEVITNDKTLPVLLKEFYDGAIYYKVDYGPELARLQSVIFIPADLGYLGSVSKDKTKIYLNEALLDYPNLARVIFLRQMGKLYGAKKAKKGHAIMGRHWDIDSKHETYAKNLRTRPEHRRIFFEHLHEVKPLEKRL